VSIVHQEPIAVIEAESYGVMSGVQKEVCSEGGQNVGYMDATDWMSYSNVTIPTTGKYTVYFRAAAASTVGKIRLEKDNGATLLGAVNIPVTGGWQTWNTVSQVMDLPAGTYNMGLAVETAGYNLNFFAIAPYISKSNPTIAITSTNAGFTGVTINLTATSSSTGAITWSVVAGNGNISGNTLTLGAAGTVTVQASIGSDANFNSGSAQQVITILPKMVSSITFADVNKTYGDAPFANSASSNSSGTFTYSIVSGNNFAAINSSTGTLTILGAGSVVLQVSQAATSTYALATKTALFSIAKKTLTATADGKSRAYASANPALTISYAGFVYGETASVIDVLPTAATSATLSSNVGTYAIIPSGGSDNNYSFTYTNGTMTITSIAPSLSITSAATGQAGSTISLTANSNSSGAITWSVVSGNGSIS
ncbi:MAG: carbohydrate-binding protein, partial [Cytophagales bacterium]|nr:carbohydrate-binding protein [Cytophagales bacterium]